MLRTFSDWREVVALDDLDAIVIALTNDQHHAAVMAALRAGKHVFCEKPLGLTLAECDDIIAAAADAGPEQVAQAVVAAGRPPRAFPARRLTRCADQFFKVAVGEFELRGRAHEAQREQARDAGRDQIPDETPGPRAMLRGPFGGVAFAGHGFP